MGTVNLLEAARHQPSVKSIVVVTSDKVYDNVEWEWDYRENDRLGGREPYGVSKACAELVIDAYRRSYFAAKGVGLASVRKPETSLAAATGRRAPDTGYRARLFGGGHAGLAQPLGDAALATCAGEPLCGYLMLTQLLSAQPAEFAGGWNFGPVREDHKPVSWIADTCARLWGSGARWQTVDGPRPYEAHRRGVTSAKAELKLGWAPRWRIETAMEETIGWYQAEKAGRNMFEETVNGVHRMISA